MKKYIASEIPGAGSIRPITKQYSENSEQSGEIALSNFEKIISTSIAVITIVAGLFFLIKTFTAFFSIVTAGPDAGKIKKAKDQVVHSILGIILLVVAYSMVGLFGSIVGLNILDVKGSILTILGE